MSGPYKCSECDGNGMVEHGVSDEYVRCGTCKGSGERWLESVFCPSQEDRVLGRVEYVEGKWRFKPGYGASVR